MDRNPPYPLRNYCRQRNSAACQDQAQLEMLSTTVEHIGEAAVRPEVGSRQSQAPGQDEHEVALDPPTCRKRAAGKRSQVLTGDSPGPLSL